MGLDSLQIASVRVDDEFLTVAEVAELLKLNPLTVRNWINRGELPAVRLGERRVRIKRSDLERVARAARHAAYRDHRGEVCGCGPGLSQVSPSARLSRGNIPGVIGHGWTDTGRLRTGQERPFRCWC